MIALSLAQTELVNGSKPKAVFGTWAMDLPVVIPVVAGLVFGAMIGAINGTFIAIFRIPFATGMFLICRGIALWWSGGNPISFPESFCSDRAECLVWFVARDHLSTDHELHSLWKTHICDRFERRGRTYVSINVSARKSLYIP